MQFAMHVYRFLFKWLMIVISYVEHIWIYISFMEVKYVAYICNLEGIFVSDTYYGNGSVTENSIGNR